MTPLEFLHLPCLTFYKLGVMWSLLSTVPYSLQVVHAPSTLHSLCFIVSLSPHLFHRCTPQIVLYSPCHSLFVSFLFFHPFFIFALYPVHFLHFSVFSCLSFSFPAFNHSLSHQLLLFAVVHYLIHETYYCSLIKSLFGYKNERGESLVVQNSHD